jgi:hypothetical protein
MIAPDDRPPHEPPHPHHHAHESSDVKPRTIALFAAGLVFVGIVIHFALVGLMMLFSSRQSAQTGLGPPLSNIPGESREPLLQAEPAVDLAALRKAEDAVLHEYRWIDRKRGVVRIPIERAMDVIAKQGVAFEKTERSQKADENTAQDKPK